MKYTARPRWFLGFRDCRDYSAVYASRRVQYKKGVWVWIRYLIPPKWLIKAVVLLDLSSNAGLIRYSSFNAIYGSDYIPFFVYMYMYAWERMWRCSFFLARECIHVCTCVFSFTIFLDNLVHFPCPSGECRVMHLSTVHVD